MIYRLILLSLLVAAASKVAAFTFVAAPTPNVVASISNTALLNAAADAADRRAFVQGLTTAVFFGMVPMPAVAKEGDVDNLAMPTPEELKANTDAEMAERLRKKAELQKKASRPVSFSESFKTEQEKQKGMQKSKTELRNAMCEELGRGC